ncbi:hypothetical protein Leryth_016740, partial [Lithospermum erythrorhizon]
FGYRSFNNFVTGKAITVNPTAQRSSSCTSACPPRKGVDFHNANPYKKRNLSDSGYQTFVTSQITNLRAGPKADSTFILSWNIKGKLSRNASITILDSDKLTRRSSGKEREREREKDAKVSKVKGLLLNRTKFRISAILYYHEQHSPI